MDAQHWQRAGVGWGGVGGSLPILKTHLQKNSFLVFGFTGHFGLSTVLVLHWFVVCPRLFLLRVQRFVDSGGGLKMLELSKYVIMRNIRVLNNTN